MKIDESGRKTFELSDLDENSREKLLEYLGQDFTKEQIKQLALAMIKLTKEDDIRIIANINFTPEMMFRLRQIGQEEKEAAVFFKDEESIKLLLQLTADEIQEARYLFNIEEISSIQDYYKEKNKTEKETESVENIEEVEALPESEIPTETSIEINLEKPEMPNEIEVDNHKSQLEEIISIAESLVVSENNEIVETNDENIRETVSNANIEGLADLTKGNSDDVFYL